MLHLGLLYFDRPARFISISPPISLNLTTTFFACQVASVHEWTLPASEYERGFTNNLHLRDGPYVPHQRARIDAAGGAVVMQN